MIAGCVIALTTNKMPPVRAMYHNNRFERAITMDRSSISAEFIFSLLTTNGYKMYEPIEYLHLASKLESFIRSHLPVFTMI